MSENLPVVGGTQDLTVVETRNLTPEEKRDWMLMNCRDEFGDIDLMGLDFSDVDGDVNISGMKVKQDLLQSGHIVGGDLLQVNHVVGQDLHQDRQEVGQDFYNHKLEDNEEWKDVGYYTRRVKKLKTISIEELKELGYELEEDK